MTPNGPLILGLRENGEYIVWDPLRQAHALVTGATGGGKTFRTRRICWCCQAAGYDLWLCDYGKGTAFRDFLGVRRVVQKPEVSALLAEARALVQERYQELERDPKAELRPVMIILEEAADCLDPDTGKTEAAKADQALVASIRDSITGIGRLGRECRVHMVIAPQRGDASLLGGSLRDQLGFRVLQLVNAKESTVNMALELGRDAQLPGREPPIRVRDIPVAPGRVLVEVGAEVVIAQVSK